MTFPTLRAAEVSAPRARAGFALGIGVALAVAAAGSWHYRWTLDDSYITFVYARNWVQGHGLVFNRGEPVEGYTCFLWVVLNALGLWLGFPVEPWSWALGISCLLGTVILTERLVRELVDPQLRWVSVFSALVVAAYPPLWWWASSGMETALLTLLLTAAFWRHLASGASSLSAPALLALASMTRPDAWLVAALLIGDAFRQGPLPLAARYAGVFAAIFGPYYGWRFWYYGYPLPNTFYAKVGSTVDQVQRGWRYLHDFLTVGRGLPMFAAAAVGLAAYPRVLWPLAVVVVAFTAAMVVLGGDYFPFYRFFLPLVPLLIAVGVAGLAVWSWRWSERQLVSACILVVATTSLLLAFRHFPERIKGPAKSHLIHRVGSEYHAKHILSVTDPGDAVATISIGRVKYLCMDRRVIDMLGLADLHIARQEVPMGRGLAGHEKYDADYVLAQLPKVILTPAPDPKWFIFPVFRVLWSHPILERHYERSNYGYVRKAKLGVPQTGSARLQASEK